jgi:hypothetical protein
VRSRLSSALLALVAVLFCLGLWKGYTSGGQDFRVFDYTARLALEGRWDVLYREGPDRFLYAPGFAILFAPLSLFPQPATHAIWLALIAVSFFISMRALSKLLGLLPTCIAVLFAMRSIWIDLRYGQVNLPILASAIWAILSFSKPASRRVLFVSWMIFGIAAISKLYPLALFSIPLLGRKLGRGEEENNKIAFTALSGAFSGILLVSVIPFVFAGLETGIFLFREWYLALGRRGFPTDTHNQSFLAFLFRLFSGEPFYSLQLGGAPLVIHGLVFSAGVLRGIWIVFSAGIGILLLRAVRCRKGPLDRDSSYFFALALCFLPAHLIWKTYFVLVIPLVAVLVRRKNLWAVAILGALLNFSSNALFSPEVSAWIEAYSFFLWIHVSVIFLFLRSERMFQPTSS